MPYIFGDDGDNILNSPADPLLNYFFFGFGGGDVIFAGNGFNYASMGAGDDRFISQSGFNIVSGGAGADTYQLANRDQTGFTYITDWKSGEDMFDVRNIRIWDFNGVKIYETQRLTYVVVEGAVFALATDDSITADDFVFGDKPIEIVTLDFEDLENPDGPTGVMPELYGGLNWVGRVLFAETDEFPDDRVDGSVPTSGTNVLSVVKGLEFSSDEQDFVPDSFYLSASASNGMVVSVTGYDDGDEVGSMDVTLNFGESTLVEWDRERFGSVDQVSIVVIDAGTGVPDADISDFAFAIDDLVFSFV